ncbi:uncharacterized protein LOC122082283 [Macadamia integrifolia]|uniref:uncharacterized protein LOC122082283 n=1 Tax=Macadamia integrifolia TaxID=60698 RepID=UPI001C4F26B7|nr:uncharacterized protein LOC122082283 [Macadamia integrifolia]
MGNCSNKGATGRSTNGDHLIRIMTDSGGIMELEGPLQVRNILDDYPGYGVFRRDQVSSPLFHHDQLLNGQSYYLLPLKKESMTEEMGLGLGMDMDMDTKVASEGKTPRLSSVGTATTTTTMGGRPAVQVLPSPGKGVWRVKLVIDTKELEEILSEQVNTEALIEKMRSAASSANATPKRSKSPWGLARRPPILSNVCKLSMEDHK